MCQVLCSTKKTSLRDEQRRADDEVKIPILSRRTRPGWAPAHQDWRETLPGLWRTGVSAPHLLEQAKNADAGGGADVDLAVGDGGGDELVSVAEMIAAVGGLVGVVDFQQGGGI